MSIPKQAQQIGVIVMVNAGDDNDPNWVTGVVEGISRRPSGSFGDLMKVDTRPHPTRQINRYADAGRISLASEQECQAFGAARIAYGLMGKVREAASLTTQIPTGDTSMAEAARTNHEQVQTVALRVTKGGKHVDLKPAQLDAIFSHPQVVETVNGLFKEGADKIVGTHQALEFKAEALERANASLAEDVQLSRTSLKSCDTERRALLQSDAQKTGEIARLKDELRAAQRKAVLSLTEAQALVKAGEKRGFVLWCPTASQPPRQVYPTHEKAVAVQEYMAKTYKDQMFHILPIGPGLKLVKPVQATRVVC